MDKKSSSLGEHRVLIIGVIIILAVFGYLIFHGNSRSSSKTNSATTQTGDKPAPASLINQIANVPEKTLDQIGVGLTESQPIPIKAPSLTLNNKPEIFFQGADFCPYCATERWALIQALSRFGTFSNLQETHSSTTDVFPGTKTFSFYKSSYTSQYISFVPLEMYTNIASASGGYTVLETPTKSEQALINKYNNSPYVPADEAGSIPFIDYANQFLTVGATYSPAVLQGLSRHQIANDLYNPNSKVAKGVDGAANTITAVICKITNNHPANVCNSIIQVIEKQFK